MDGLEELRAVVVIGATNRPDVIDPALIRPGRFDELILVPIPDEGARREIFKVHTEKMALAEDIDIEKLVSMTDQYTGADIAAVCKKAGRDALREDLHDVFYINRKITFIHTGFQKLRDVKFGRFFLTLLNCFKHFFFD